MTHLLFGGPYSNLHATQALLERARTLGIPPQRILCTGDVVAYCADPAATVALLRESGVRVVMGNCEQQLAAGGTGCGCGFTPGSACDRLSAAWYAHADAALDADARAWMAALPRTLTLALDGPDDTAADGPDGNTRPNAQSPRTLRVVHGAPGDISRFVFASSPDLPALMGDAPGIVAGHCGLPFTRVLDGRVWHNPGAIGMPANDGTPRGWFSLVRAVPGGLAFQHCPLDYDHAAAAAAMRRAGLPEGYAAALATGRWPSEDVLPPSERRLAGIPIIAATVPWRLPRAARQGQEERVFFF